MKNDEIALTTRAILIQNNAQNPNCWILLESWSLLRIHNVLILNKLCVEVFLKKIGMNFAIKIDKDEIPEKTN